jgi:hypothetical protein
MWPERYWKKYRNHGYIRRIYLAGPQLRLPDKVQEIVMLRNAAIMYPSTLTSLRLCSNFNRPITNGSLPSTLRVLVFGSHYNQLTALPPALTTLKFGFRFNKPLDSLPANLTKLVFGYTFQQQLPPLPESLCILKLGGMFNHKLVLPNNLRMLELAQYYTQPLTALPVALKGLCVSTFTLLYVVDLRNVVLRNALNLRFQRGTQTLATLHSDNRCWPEYLLMYDIIWQCATGCFAHCELANTPK